MRAGSLCIAGKASLSISEERKETVLLVFSYSSKYITFDLAIVYHLR